MIFGLRLSEITAEAGLLATSGSAKSSRARKSETGGEAQAIPCISMVSKLGET